MLLQSTPVVYLGRFSVAKMAKSTVKMSLGHAGDTMVSWGYQGHDEQRAAAIIGALLGYASLKNALGFGRA